MRRPALRSSALAILVVWSMATGIAPAVTLHVAIEHHEHHEQHAPAGSASNRPEVSENGHHGSDHHHPDIGPGIAPAGARLHPVPWSAVLPLPLWASVSGGLDPSFPRHGLDSRNRSSPTLLRSCILLL